MHIRTQLLVEHSKSNAEIISNYIGANERRVEELVKCFLSKEYRVSQRSAMVVSILANKHPELLSIHLEQLVNAFNNPKEKDAVIRVVVRFFQFYDLPEKYEGIVLERCYQLLKDGEQAIAIRAFAMGVIYKISQPYEELKTELKLVLEDLYTGGSSGLENRRKNILKLL